MTKKDVLNIQHYLDKHDKNNLVKIRFLYGLYDDRRTNIYVMDCQSPIVGRVTDGKEAMELAKTCLEIVYES